MKTMTVKCQVLTPIISRKDESGTFDLSPQSVKGVLHFWFRAVAPRVIDIYKVNLSALSKEEREIFEKEKYAGLKYLEEQLFGSQRMKAPFGVWVEYNQNDCKQLFYHDTPDRFLGGDSIKYALHGLSRRILYFRADSTFDLNFTFKDQLISNVILSILRLAGFVGGLGAKTTKGFGKFLVLDQKKSIFKEQDMASLIRQLVSDVEQNLKVFIENAKNINNKPLKDVLILNQNTQKRLYDFPNFCDGSFKIIDTGVQARYFSEVMSKLFVLTEDRKGWYKTVKFELRKATNNGNDCVETLKDILNNPSKAKNVRLEIPPAALGMPLVYYFPDTRITVTFAPCGSEKIGRKQSPLRFVLQQTNDRGFKAYAILFFSHLSDEYEDGYKVKYYAFRKKRNGNDEVKEDIIKDYAYIPTWDVLSQRIENIVKSRLERR